jgi:uncharacterized protein YidB (DUF937 family)
MDLMDTLQSVLGGNKQQDILSSIMGLIGGQGGLNNLIGQFASKGLGDLIGSWVGTGKNLPISPDQIKSVLGEDKLKSLAANLGLSSNDVTSHLSNLLPNVVDKLTPDGKVPEEDLMRKGMDLLGGLFK